jgi:hypothetical protein
MYADADELALRRPGESERFGDLGVLLLMPKYQESLAS